MGRKAEKVTTPASREIFSASSRPTSPDSETDGAPKNRSKKNPGDDRGRKGYANHGLSPKTEKAYEESIRQGKTPEMGVS